MEFNFLRASTHEWQTVFSIFDRDQDGVISANDLYHLMCSLGQTPTPDQLQQVTNLAGLEQNKPLQFAQFLDYFSTNPVKAKEEPLRQTFIRFDVNGDGVIDSHDLATALTTLGEKTSIQDATTLLQNWVQGSELHLDYQEFVKVMLAKNKNWNHETVSSSLENSKDKDSEMSAVDYVRSLQEQVMNHKAVHHPYLVRLANGQLPNLWGSLKDFAIQYYAYSQHFRSYLQGTISHLTANQRQGLSENLAEESGQLDLAHQEHLLTLGIQPDWVKDIPHPQLFQQFQTALGIQDSNLTGYCPEAIAFTQRIQSICSQNAAMGVGALGLGTELIVQPMYRYILQAIQNHTSLTPKEYVFFSLHAEVDDHHGEVLLNLAIDLATTPEARIQLKKGMESALDARCSLWDELLKRALAMPNTSESNEEKQDSRDPNPSSSTKSVWTLNQNGATAAKLYDAQSQNWVRREPSCLSDFTARPEVFKLCAPVQGLRVLDLGCGEGYCARELKRQGAAEIIAVDISEKMIAAAQAEEEREPLGIRYFQGNGTEITAALQQQRFITEEEVVNGAFDLIVCVFLFNYVTLADMETCMQQAYQLLRPGGRFVFSVPHPSFAFWDRQPEPPFYFKRQSSELGDAPGYFTSQDRLLPGIICRKDGTELNVQVRHKTLQDYFDLLQQCGFTTMPRVKELHVTEELLAMDRDYFAPLKNVPLHLAFSIQKSEQQNAQPSHGSQEILWSRLFSEKDYQIQLSPEVLKEFYTASRYLENHGITWENYYAGDAGDLPHLTALGLDIRQKLKKNTGIALLQGLDFTLLGETFEQQEQAAKLFYLMVSQAVGTVLTKRGRLYDVINRHLDIADDNVLFSATNEASGWHTDSTDKDFFPDFVGLMSLRTSLNGGLLQVTNAINVYYRLRSVLPSFIFQQLETPIIRDLIETGLGAQSGDVWERLRRNPQIKVQAERIRQNAFPIFAHDPVTKRFSFRYMRYWIESGYKRAEQPLSPLLAIAMNALDKTLAEDRQIQRVECMLQPGEIIFLNNHICPHNRTAFQDDPADPRKMVRVWLSSKEDLE